MGDEGEALKVEFIDERGDVVGEGVEIVAAGGLIGTAVAAAVETDTAESFIRERGHLIVPHLAAAAQTVEEQSGGARAPLAPIKLGSVAR